MSRFYKVFEDQAKEVEAKKVSQAFATQQNYLFLILLLARSGFGVDGITPSGFNGILQTVLPDTCFFNGANFQFKA